MNTATLPNRNSRSTRLSLMLLALCLPAAHAAVWTASEGGEWFDDGNWDTTAPNGIDAIADFRFDKTDPNDFIRMSSPPTVGKMFFENTGTSGETFLVMAGGAAGNIITFEASGGSNATMDVAANHNLNVRGGLILNSTLEKTGEGLFTSNTTNGITGTGGFILNGGSAEFLLDNTYSGGTAVEAGTLQVGDNAAEAGNLGTGDVSVGSGGVLDFNRPDLEAFVNNIPLDGTLRQIGDGGLELDGTLTGSGNIVNSGTSYIRLDGANTFSGDFDLQGSNLFIRGGNSTYSGDFAVASAAKLIFASSSSAAAGNATISGVISGDGAVEGSLGAGEKAILTGNNTYAGITAIGTNGTLQIGDGGTTGTLGSGDLDMDVSTSVLIFNRSDTVNVANNFDLDGTIRQEGSGDLNLDGVITLDGSNGDIVTASGATNLNGTLVTEVDTTAGDAQVLNVPGALNLGGATLSPVEDNPGTLDAGTKVTLIDYTAGSLTGTFAGLSEGATLTIGANNFTISYADASQVTLTVPGGGYNEWATANAGSQDEGEDFDGDGVPNGVEYFMGETGSSFTPNPGVVAGTITWPKDPTADASYVVEVSSNLQDELTAGDGGWTEAAPSDVADNGTSVVYTVPSGDPRLFARLRVTTP